MRFRARPAEGEGFHPLGEQLSTDPAVERRKIYRVDLLDDGTALLLAEARGDRDRYREILESSEHVLGFSVTDGGEGGWWYSYTHFEPTEVTERMLEVGYVLGLAMEMPIEVEPGGSMVFTLVGPEGAFAEAVRADAPRAATHEDVAREVDAAPSTVGEHLRKVESRVFAQLVR